jgi:hypothetical protein
MVDSHRVMVGGGIKTGVYKFNIDINPNGFKDSSGNRVEKGFSQFPVVISGYHFGVCRFDLPPNLLILRAAHKKVFYAAFNLIDDLPVQAQSRGGIALHVLPVPVFKAQLCPLRNAFVPGMIRVQGFVNYIGSQIGKTLFG